MYGHPSYFTMNIHHFATIISIVYSYLTNFEEYGMLVLLLSDVSDCFLNLAKQAKDLERLKGTKLDILFTVMVLVWLYTRTFSLPICFTLSWYKWLSLFPSVFRGDFTTLQMFNAAKPGIYFVIFNVNCIVALNMYWTKLLYELAINKILNKSDNYTHSYEGLKTNQQKPVAEVEGSDRSEE